MSEPIRCGWPKNELANRYHDQEWGVPQHDDRVLFEFLVLDAAQAGLSWDLILKKRDGYRAAFAQFDSVKVARFDSKKIASLLQNPNIIRNRLKIASAITNAKLFLEVQREFGSFDKYIWGFVDHQPIDGRRKTMRDVPATSPESDAISADLRKRGFKFVGSTICYAFMQAAGLVNDHTVDCFRYRQIKNALR